MHRYTVFTLLSIWLISVCASSLPIAATAEAQPWIVVGVDRMGVAVLQGDSPRFILHQNLVGPGWKGGRLVTLAKVEGNIRVLWEKKVGFYARPWDK